MVLWLWKVLKDLGITQKKFAESILMHPVRLNNILQMRKKPMQSEIKAIVDALGMSEDHLFSPGYWDSWSKLSTEFAEAKKRLDKTMGKKRKSK